MQLRFILTLFGIITLSLSDAQVISHIGTWESKDVENPMQMVLDDDGFITFIVNKRSLGGKHYISEGKHLSMCYETTYTDTIGTISILVKDCKTKRVLQRDTGKLTFTGPNNIELCFKKPLNEERTEFTDECVSFLKVK